MAPECTPSSLAVPTVQGTDHLLSKQELARYLGVTGRTVEEYQRRGLPYFRLSARRNRYDLMAVRAWLERQCRVVRVR
jgi:phage terminase Nu1 subunit (DNA packaging protein)